MFSIAQKIKQMLKL